MKKPDAEAAMKYLVASHHKVPTEPGPAKIEGRNQKIAIVHVLGSV